MADTAHMLKTTTAHLREVERAMRAAQALNPQNRDDAEYIAAHPSDFRRDQLAEALRCLRRLGR
jgi:hypothetical protein